ncbi:adenine phosphoribosyltransferase 2-like [Panicum miliaceum]|uniref:adenine phosphoribosyltransferase n=1 Tax=Panicum miliaceum TaxID=4540 RepID=A0A3L6QB19_PANMI|nr:adenine phosphoribosyltransferase 2-like [Panicum miliaceum]
MAPRGAAAGFASCLPRLGGPPESPRIQCRDRRACRRLLIGGIGRSSSARRDLMSSDSASIEARGFIFGPAIALAIGAKFIPLRKPKKLPGDVFSESYVLEYGTDCLEMHVGAIEPGERTVVVDDLVATGGTLSAAIRLLGTFPHFFISS